MGNRFYKFLLICLSCLLGIGIGFALAFVLVKALGLSYEMIFAIGTIIGVALSYPLIFVLWWPHVFIAKLAGAEMPELKMNFKYFFLGAAEPKEANEILQRIAIRIYNVG